MYITKLDGRCHNTTHSKSNNNINTSILNAINTVDYKTNNLGTKTDEAYNANICIPVLATFIPLYVIAAIFFSKKLNNTQKMKWIAPVSLFSALCYSIFSKKRANASFNGHIAGQQSALQHELTNPKLFAALDKEQQKTIQQNKLYQYYSNKHYSNKVNILPNYDFFENNKFINKISKEAKTLKLTQPQETEIYKKIEEIDKRTNNYTNKVIKGINLMIAGSCCTVMLALNQYSKHTQTATTKKIPLLLSAIFAILPMSILSKMATSSFFDNLNKVSRYKAKQDFITDNISDKKSSENSLSTAFDYILNKSKYKKEVQRQDQLTMVKNNIITQTDFSSDKLEEAKDLQKNFYEAINSTKRINMIKENKLYNEILREGVVNCALLSLLQLPLLNIIDLFSRNVDKKKFHNNLIIINVITFATCLINTMIASHINTKNKVA